MERIKKIKIFGNFEENVSFPSIDGVTKKMFSFTKNKRKWAIMEMLYKLQYELT